MQPPPPSPPSSPQIDRLLRELTELKLTGPGEDGAAPRSLRDELPPHY
jgi:hypothetical protein